MGSVVASDKRKWARRALGLSFVLLVLALVSLYRAYPDYLEASDPESNNLVKVKPGESSEFQISEDTVLTALRLAEGGDPPADLRLVDEEGAEIPGRSPVVRIDRVGSDEETLYSPVRIFESVAEGRYSLYNDAESSNLWLVDDGALAEAIDGNVWIYVFYFSCCLGSPMGIIGIILVIMAWADRRKAPDQFLLVQDGSVIFTNIDEIGSVNEMREDINQEVSEGVPSPFVGEVKTLPNEPKEDKEEDSSNWKSWDEG